jgi:phosphatidylethanolamine/phosphatidyl-N-methylethanolamine N-methyltransferase
MSEVKNFRKEFWKEKKTVGAMAPSSRYLTEKMLKNIDFKSAKVLVELGPGTGVFTHEIIARMGKDATLLVFEINDSFFDGLQKKIKDSRVHLIHDSAERIDFYLKKYHLEKADAVISSLPLAVFPPQLRTSILQASEEALIPAGKYIQFQYSLQSKSLLKKLYKQVKISFTPLNFPPAFVYTCLKK